jgi:hypothetical protein
LSKALARNKGRPFNDDGLRIEQAGKDAHENVNLWRVFRKFSPWDREQGWIAYSGWRVNYDTVILNLATFVEAPPAPWVSDRSPLRPEQICSLRQAAETRPA